MTRQQIQQAIETFRKITIANTISPENVGVLLRALLDFATSSDEAAQAAAALISGYSLHAKAASDSITITLRNALGNVVGEGCKIPLANGSTTEAGLLSPREKEQIDDNRLDIIQLNTELNDSVHQLYNYIDQSDQFITTDLTKKINAADTRATEALELAESLDDSRGEPDGLATLDGYGHLDPAQIDPDTIGVRVFNGFVEGATIEQVGINGTPGFSSIVYDTRARKFLLQAGAKYYEAWPECSKYNSPDTLEPHPERIYICTTKGGVWWWNGQELEDITANGLILQKIERASTKTFDDLFLAAAGTWGRIDHTHTNEDGTPSPYYLNELWLTYLEAVAVWLDGTLDSQYSGGHAFTHRTNLPLTSKANHLTIAEAYQSDNIRFEVEVANVSNSNFPTAKFSAYPISVWNKPFGFSKLRRIIGDIDFHFARTDINWFVGAVNLEEIRITRLAWSINLGSCARLSPGSVRYMIEQALTKPGHDTPRTVTLHAEVYDKIVEAATLADTDKLSAWSGLLELAASKNITFASA